MNFKHSIIIPYKLYKKFSLDKNDTSVDILTDETLPSDVKLKLYNQSKIGATSSTASIDTSEPDIRRGDFILSNIPDKDKPVVGAILNLMHKNKTRTDYNDQLELILDGEVLPESNLINVLLFLTKNIPITSDNDIPTGSIRLKDKLEEIGMPTIWIKRISKKRRAARPPSPDKPVKALKWQPL